MTFFQFCGGICCGLLLLAGCNNKNAITENRQDQIILSSQIEQIRNDRDAWQDRYEKLQAIAENLQTQVQNLGTKLIESGKKAADLEQQMALQKTALDGLQTKLSDANAQIIQMKLALATAEKERDKNQDELTASEKKLADSETENADLKKKVRELRQKIDAIHPPATTRGQPTDIGITPPRPPER